MGYHFYSFVVLAMCFSAFTVGIEYKIPSFVKICPKNVASMPECLREAAETIAPHLKEGIPSMRIPPLDPFVIDKIEFNVGNMKATFTNIKVYNGTKLRISEVFGGYPKHMGGAILQWPNLHLEGDYEVHGKLLLLELNGSGKGSLELTNTRAKLTYKTGREVRDGVKYLTLEDSALSLNISRIHFDFGELFKNNPQLSEITNQVINDNLSDFIRELLPVVNKALKDVAFGIVRNLLSAFPEEVLFP